MSAVSDEKSKSISKPNADELYDEVEDALDGSRISASISSNILRVSDVSFAPDKASSASVSVIMARISSADRPT